MHKWLPTKYSFVFVLIRPTSLVLKEHFFCILSVLTRLVSLISKKTKEYLFGRHLCIRSMLYTLLTIEHSVSGVKCPSLDIGLPIVLHWSVFHATQCQCFAKPSKSSLHLVLGLPRFLVCPWLEHNAGCPTVVCSSGHMNSPIPFEFTYRFHDISYFGFFN